MTHVSRKQANELKLKQISRDFRTDTITIPTDDMFDLMKEASRGDDVYGVSGASSGDRTRIDRELGWGARSSAGVRTADSARYVCCRKEDQATNDLQDRVAKLAGKEAGLFCVSGTMTNQLAIRSHLTQPPHSIILDARAHVHLYEAGGVAFHSQASSHAVPPANGHHLTLEEVLNNAVFGEDIHSAPTRLVALENTLSGMVFPQEEIVRISDKMRKEGIIMHCDGARLWEVVAKTGTSLEELCRPFDTVSLCMSKGLGAPIGSVLVGPKKFIERCKWFRKCFGGGVRQCGGLAACADWVLDNHLPKLKQTHEMASRLAQPLADLGVQLMLPVETNMLWLQPTSIGFTIQDLAERAKERHITLGSNRVVIHHQISPQALDDLVDLVREMKEEFKDAPKTPLDWEQNQRFAKGTYEGDIQPPIARLGTNYGRNQ